MDVGMSNTWSSEIGEPFIAGNQGGKSVAKARAAPRSYSGPAFAGTRHHLVRHLHQRDRHEVVRLEVVLTHDLGNRLRAQVPFDLRVHCRRFEDCAAQPSGAISR
jgi:hypothetical protein